MKVNPRILITNDDGVDAPGLVVMCDIAKALSNDVWVVAPRDNMSGAGHQLSFGRELTMEQRDKRIFAVSGSPADCVVTAITHVLKDKKPDIVLSGVNQGQNLGDLIHCSGTVAGAREGAQHGAIGIALSQAVDYANNAEVDWTPTKDIGKQIVKSLIAEASGADVFYNVNFPLHRDGAEPALRVVPHQRFSNSPFAYYASRNEGKFFVAIPETPMPLDEEADFHTLHHDHAITVTPLKLQQTDRDEMQHLETRLRLEN